MRLCKLLHGLQRAVVQVTPSRGAPHLLQVGGDRNTSNWPTSWPEGSAELAEDADAVAVGIAVDADAVSTLICFAGGAPSSSSSPAGLFSPVAVGIAVDADAVSTLIFFAGGAPSSSSSPAGLFSPVAVGIAVDAGVVADPLEVSVQLDGAAGTLCLFAEGPSASASRARLAAALLSAVAFVSAAAFSVATLSAVVFFVGCMLAAELCGKQVKDSLARPGWTTGVKQARKQNACFTQSGRTTELCVQGTSHCILKAACARICTNG